METMYSVRLNISKVENGQYLAESKDVPGWVAQGRTIPEVIEIAQDVTRKLIDSYIEHGDPVPNSMKAILKQSGVDVDKFIFGHLNAKHPDFAYPGKMSLKRLKKEDYWKFLTHLINQECRSVMQSLSG